MKATRRREGVGGRIEDLSAVQTTCPADYENSPVEQLSRGGMLPVVDRVKTAEDPGGWIVQLNGGAVPDN